MAKAGLQAIGEKKRQGGWRGSPNSIAALHRYRNTWREHRKCVRCGRVAMAGTNYCWQHQGKAVVAQRNGRAESATLKGMETAGLLPGDLVSLPVWRNLAPLPTSARAPARLSLVLAWGQRDKQPLVWAQAFREAARIAREVAPSPWRNAGTSDFVTT